MCLYYLLLYSAALFHNKCSEVLVLAAAIKFGLTSTWLARGVVGGFEGQKKLMLGRERMLGKSQ